MFCYNYPGPEYTYIRGSSALPPGRHKVRFEFEKIGKEPVGAGGVARLYVDGQKTAEGEIARTCTVGYTMDETFDVGWDKGTPVSEEYGPNSQFTGLVHRVDFDLKPDFHPDAIDPSKNSNAKFQQAMLRQ